MQLPSSSCGCVLFIRDRAARCARAQRRRAGDAPLVGRGWLQSASAVEVWMAIKLTRSIGMTLLAFWLILTGLDALIAITVPTVLTSVFALLAGVMILAGR
jgi:hypothetical protein